MPAFEGARVALLESRMRGEMASLVTRHGGRPYCVPAVREVPLAPGAAADPAAPEAEPDATAAFIERLCADRFAYVLFLTGVGAAALVDAAERRGRRLELLAALRRTTTVCRGPKPAAVLRRHRVPVGIAAEAPHTSAELLAALAYHHLEERDVALIHYGERNDALAAALAARGARLDELALYEYRLPDDVGPLRTLVADLIEGRVDAVAFTSQVQCRHLFQIARDLGRERELAEALDRRVPVAAIGPVCADALKTLGVTPRVMPATPKMAPLIAALADYFELLSDSTTER